MSLTTLAQLRTVKAVSPFQKAGATSNSVALASLWKSGSLPAAAATPPTGAGEVPTSATPGALAIPSVSASLYLARLLAHTDTSLDSAILTLYDRLVHTSGVVSNSTTPQTVNSAAVTRPSSGVGCLAFLEVYTAFGATATSFSVSYTNQAGTAGQVSPTTSLGGSTATAGALIPIPLVPGDTGVRSVESVTFGTATAAAGAAGITIGKPIASVTTKSPAVDVRKSRHEFQAVVGAAIDPSACLAFWLNTTSSTATIYGEAVFAEA